MTKPFLSRIRAKAVFILLLILCLQSPTAKAQCCQYRLLMHDTYGDGWNGAKLQVKINNVSVGFFAASNYGSMAVVPVCGGDSIKLVYSPGIYENENSYQLLDSSWNVVFQDGPDPDTGIVFKGVGNCNTPLLQGSHPCTAIPTDTGVLVAVNNTGYQGSGMLPNCSWFNGGDIWYKMKVPPSGNLSIETFSGTIDDTGIAAWTGNGCTGLNIVGCDDDSGTGYLSYLLLFDLTPNDTLYIQAWKWGGGGGTFQMQIRDLGKVVLDSTELPIVMIHTLGQTIVDEPKINCLMEIKYNGPGNITYATDPPNVYNGHVGIEIRGASSSGYPQRPYGFETRTPSGGNNNVPILGMPPENDWVLISNFNDRSLVKNLIAYKLFGEMGQYSPRAQLCEVLIDSSYKGIYMIGEKIKRDNNRVDIASLLPTDTVGDELTGGYILQQNYWDASNSVQSNYSPIGHAGMDVHFLYEYPDPVDIQTAQKKYIASYVDSLETALYSAGFADPFSGYRKYMDVKSFIDYFITNEVARNADGFKKSVFYHKDKHSNGGKLKAGPVWDFDWAWKNLEGVCFLFEGYKGGGWAHHVNDCNPDNNSTGWYLRLLQDTTFSSELRCTYEVYRQSILDTAYIFHYIDSIGQVVKYAQERHFRKWPILGKSGPAPDFGPVATTYYGELDSLKRWILIRLQWLDANMPGTCPTSGVAEINMDAGIKCYPNPANGLLNVEYFLLSPENVTVRVLNCLGVEVYFTPIGTQNPGQHTMTIDTNTLMPGVYVLFLSRGTKTQSEKFLVIHE